MLSEARHLGRAKRGLGLLPPAPIFVALALDSLSETIMVKPHSLSGCLSILALHGKSIWHKQKCAKRTSRLPCLPCLP